MYAVEPVKGLEPEGPFLARVPVPLTVHVHAPFGKHRMWPMAPSGMLLPAHTVLAPGFSWPPRLGDVPDIRDISRKSGVMWSMEYVPACVDKLVKFLGEPDAVTVGAV